MDEIVRDAGYKKKRRYQTDDNQKCYSRITEERVQNARCETLRQNMMSELRYRPAEKGLVAQMTHIHEPFAR